ncbi:hypothetical protein, partial [Marinococcus halophilus]|uniref:hypothetical protein n=1 Tax=Marinococcus halophilus TaxID=1371 RepID=UPI001E566C77
PTEWWLPGNELLPYPVSSCAITPFQAISFYHSIKKLPTRSKMRAIVDSLKQGSVQEPCFICVCGF